MSIVDDRCTPMSSSAYYLTSLLKDVREKNENSRVKSQAVERSDSANLCLSIRKVDSNKRFVEDPPITEEKHTRQARQNNFTAARQRFENNKNDCTTGEH